MASVNGDEAGTSIQIGIRGSSPPLASPLRALALLRTIGTEGMPHAAGRSLYDHLCGTSAIVAAWRQPADVRLAALFHSAYGTSAYPAASARDRRAVRGAIGDAAERLAFAFGDLDRAAFAAAIGEMDEPRACTLAMRSGSATLSGADVAALTVLGVANEIEQTCAPDRSPANWRARCPSLVAALARWTTVDLPPRVHAALGNPFDAADEAIAAYARAVRALARCDRASAERDFGRACACEPHVAEPFVWRAFLARRSADAITARAHVARARSRFDAWGSAWDKRLSFDEWLAVLASIDAGTEPEALATLCCRGDDPR